MRRFIAFFLASIPAVMAHAHSGHGNTVVHAMAHFAESGGLWVWSLLALAVGLGAWRLRARRASKRSKRP